MKYHSVLFDLGSTLVYSPADKTYPYVLNAFGVQKDPEEIKRAFYLADKTFMRDYPHVLGTNPECFMPWFLGIVNYYLDIRLNLEETFRSYQRVCRNMNLGWLPVPGAIDLLKELRQRGVHTGLISNWDSSCRSVLKKNGLDSLLDTVVISSEVGVEKPDSRIFETALRMTDFAPEQTLFVGDNYYDDVIGGSTCGIRCLLLTPFEKLGVEEIDYSSTLHTISEVMNYLE